MELRAAIWETLRTANWGYLVESNTVAFSDISDKAAWRLAQVLYRGSNISVEDTLALLRHFLRGDEGYNLVPGNNTVHIEKAVFVATQVQWNAFGFDLLLDTQTHALVRPLPWHPAWLSDANHLAPDETATRRTRRRQMEAIAGDPFLHSLGYQTYRSEGQRAAIRSVLATPSGATLIINLPTAMGKSLCAQILGTTPFLNAKGRGVVVVVVPTIALAIDQARSYGTRRGDAHNAVAKYAYQGGGANNDQLKQRIRDGDQEIVFAAPESLIGSLRSCLYDAAEKGYLKALVIDEAHMVEAWGDEFRPAFQELAGLRRALLATTPSTHPRFRTVLLSATLPLSAIERLNQVFGEPGQKCAQVASLQLRPEPQYWMRGFFYPAEHEDGGIISADEQRESAVLETLRHVPRPVILYVSEVDEAKAWTQKLRNAGFRRLDCMTGDTQPEEREKIIERWNENRTDIVVATSAFGLGMDKGDVRTVIHACLPETIDRFYQEVGRGGRDGDACLSFLLYTGGDNQTATNLSVRRLISTEKGLPRWKRLFENAQALPGERFLVNLDMSPGVGEDNIDMIGERNRKWNARTLTLLQQAAIIELDDSRPAQGDPNARNKRTLRIRRDDHLDEAMWLDRIETHRSTANDAARAQRESMMAATPGRGRTACVSTILDGVYTLPDNSVARCCGGCPACRRENRSPFAQTPSVSDWCWSDAHGRELLSDKMSNACREGGGILLSYDASWKQDKVMRELRDALTRFVDAGVRLILFPEYTSEATIVNLCKAITLPTIFVERGFNSETTPRRLPTVVICLPPAGDIASPPTAWDETTWRIIKRRILTAHTDTTRSPFFVIAPNDTPDTAADYGNEGRTAIDMWACRRFALNAFVQEYYL